MGKKTHVSTHFRPSLQAVLLVLYPWCCIAMIFVQDFRRRFQLNALRMLGFSLMKRIYPEKGPFGLCTIVIHLQNVRKVLPKDCLANKEPTECFFPAELIKSIRTPMFILNPSYDSWQIRNFLVPDSSAPDKSWLSCKENIRNCNSTQVEVLDGLRNKMVNDLKVVEDKEDWGMFIDSCFTHCQSLSGVSWHSPTSPKLENKTIAEAVGDWHSGRSQGAKEIDCKYQCNPTCNSLPPPRDVTAFDRVEIY